MPPVAGPAAPNSTPSLPSQPSTPQQPPRQTTPQQPSQPISNLQTTHSPKSQPPSSRSSPLSQALPNNTERHTPAVNEFLRHQPPPAFRPPHEFHPTFFPNGNGLFRPGFPPGYQHPAHHHPTVIQHSPVAPTSVQNGEFGKYFIFSFLGDISCNSSHYRLNCHIELN